MKFVGPLYKEKLGGVWIFQRYFDVKAFICDQQTFGIIKRAGIEKAVNKRQAEFIAGRCVAGDALASLGYSSTTEIPIGKGRAPVWPQKITGSISHNHNLAVCVAGWAQDHLSLGVDVESNLDQSTIDSVSPLIMTTDELAVFEHNHWSKTQITTLLFSAKESLFKALYPLVQQYLEFHDATLISVNKPQGILQFRFSSQLKALCGKNGCQCYFRLGSDNVTTLVCL